MTYTRSLARTVAFFFIIGARVGADLQQEEEEEENPCRLYLAPSTIPGAGLGIFAGVDFDVDDTVLTGDIVVPLDNIPFHTGSASWAEGVKVFFLWGDYTWDTSIVSGAAFDYEGISGVNSEGEEQVLETVEMASPGMGSMPNCKFGFVNINSEFAKGDTANEDRNSPANGAFTPYHDRVGKARIPIESGAEIFEDYGVDYFTNRPGLTEVPHEEDYETATELLGGLRKLRTSLQSRRGRKSLPVTSIIRDLYDVVKGAWTPSRVMNALPNQPLNDNYTNDKMYDEFLDVILNNPSTHMEQKKTIRDIRWLREEGICMDGIRGGTSDIPYAGRGAFAARDFQKGDRIAPVPLIHMPDDSILTTYAPKLDNRGGPTNLRNTSSPLGTQLMKNYCFGHKNSTMLLSPYGHITSMINHGSGKDSNARMVWAQKWMREPEWLKLPPEKLMGARYAGLGFDLIALRDIQVDEEVLIDYGPEWEAAWTKHVSDWYSRETIPTGTSMPYVPANKLNENKEQILSDIVEGKIDYTYKGYGVSLNCYYYGSAIPLKYGNEYHTIDATQECRPVQAYKSLDETGDEQLLFVAEIVEWIEGEDEEWHLEVEDVIFDASPTIFFFKDRPYNTAHQMRWSFRHTMAIPDDILPDAWMNRS